jgi:hypothetical protein
MRRAAASIVGDVVQRHRLGRVALPATCARDLINTLRRRDLDDAASKLSAETGLAYRPSAEGDDVSGV